MSFLGIWATNIKETKLAINHNKVHTRAKASMETRTISIVIPS